MKSRASNLPRAVLAVAMPTIVALVGVLLGCATTQAMRSGPGVPASEGTVSTSAADNGNTNVTVRVEHLAPAWKVAADATVYVVWIQPRNDPAAAWQSVGAMSLDDDLDGTLDTVTSQNRFLVMVTPEPNGQVELPSHEAVLTADVGPE